MLHGRLLGGVAARAIEADLDADGAAGPDHRVARLTVDLFRPAAMAPVTVSVTPVRRGRRLRVVDATVTVDGHDVARATAVVLATGVEPPGRIWRPEALPWPAPDTVLDPEAQGADERWLLRTVDGGFGTGDRTRLWSADTAPLVDDEVMSPLVRAAVSGDIACPLANSSDQGLHYINGDYTLAMSRYPAGEWVGIEVAQQFHHDGIAVASANLVDGRGVFATSTGTSLARPPLEHEA